ncbi:hypothetical protein EIP91_005100 [Steccherinum ochraceum]|uniref:BTB domain-containing protein n=1 Tax=Steccherinum ochraceum TaxID=92696 RepID=A0A4R0RDT9_9APHY|nr:hypothetical protein EIP91_005100 [Steccherinum ochraceum]
MSLQLPSISNDQPRPPKRARSDTSASEHSGEDSTYKRSEAFWIRDGNVILVAEQVTFRVHQGVLGRKSVIFEDMFGVPQPENAEKLEGCPLVHVSDTAEDIEHLLSVLYDGDRFLSATAQISMKMVFALLQLGIKYEIDFLRDEAINILNTAYPSSFLAYMRQHTVSSGGTERVTGRGNDDAIITINLAWKHRLHALLPGAFYACALTPIKKLAMSTRNPGSEAEDLAKLTSEDMERCLNGREHLQWMYLARYSILDVTRKSNGCLNPSVCESLRAIWKRCNEMSYTKKVFQFDFDPMEPLPLGVDEVGHCSRCESHFEGEDSRARIAMYNGLASTFGLEDFM